MATRENKIVTLPAHIRVRRDTLANWTSINPVLDDGELAIVRMPDGSITMRVGTGADSFKNLPDISNSGADEIHVLDSITTEQLSGTLSTSDYELCANNNVIGVKNQSGEEAIVNLFYKILEGNGVYFFSAAFDHAIWTITLLASKQYSTEQVIIPTALEADENTVRMNHTEAGIAFDLAKDESGKVQITLNGASVGTGITLPGHAVADIEGLQAALDGKANSVHTHVHTDVTDFDTSVDSLIDAKLDSLPEVTIPEYTLKSGSVEGTVALYKDGTGSDTKVNGYDNLKAQVGSKYAKPSGGIPKSDLTSDVRASLGKADTALQTAPEYTLETGADGISLKKDGATVGDPVAIASNKGKLLDYDGNEIFNADQSDDVKVILFDCGGAELPPSSVDELIAMSAANIVNENWVGVTIPIKIDNKDVLFRISDVNTYDLSDGSGKSHYTLEMVDILENRRMSATAINTGGWAETEAEAYLNSDEALNRIEEKVRNAIQQVKIPYGSVYNRDSLLYVDNKVFYPSYLEVGFTGDYVLTVEGRIWKYYNDNNSNSTRIKNLNSNAADWWLRSCGFQSTSYFCMVYSSGASMNGNASATFGSSWAFCI